MLVALGLIALGLLMEQRRFSPALDAVPVDKEPAPTEQLPLPPGWAALGPAEVFGADDLSDKIDGRAELYLGAGFTRLVAQRMQRVGQPDVWLEILLYTMQSSDAAFAVFSGQRRAGAQPLAVGDEGYVAENAAFAVRGNLYAEAVAAQAGLGSDLEAVLRGVLGDKGKTAAPVRAEKDLLPIQDQVPGTFALIPENAFGFERFNRLYVASYSNAAGMGTFFVSLRASTEEAESLAAAYCEFITENGGAERAEQVQELFGRFEAVASAGNWLVGVHDALDATWAGQALALLLERARAETGEAP